METRSRCFRQSKNNFSGIDISQGLDWEPPSLSPHFLLVWTVDCYFERPRSQISRQKDGGLSKEKGWHENAAGVTRLTEI